ncbi:MAG: choice-of-anchor D domain-containing protein [Treponema sp.]|nr:choice-of-anchor D domain-containing protein [Treponema sp.]MBR4631535.1 choice-of-anchor D domain-containing protein [Treponema sp.]
MNELGDIQVMIENSIVTNGESAYAHTIDDIYVSDDENEYKELSCTIKNIGEGTLNLLGTPLVKMSGATAAFSITSQPNRSSLKKGESTQFAIRFKPNNTGDMVATVIIPNDGRNNQEFVFKVYGKGLKEKPSICISTAANENVEYGSTVDFGQVSSDQSLSVQFYVQNTGRKMLSISGSPKIAISGSGSEFFTATAEPGDTVSAGGKSVFEITFTPNGNLTEQSAIISIESNDTDKATFSFIVKAKGTIFYPVLNLSCGESDLTSLTAALDFNTINQRLIVGKTYQTEITFRNTGNANLKISSNSIQIKGEDADCFAIEQYPLSTIVPEANSSAIVSFKPKKQGNASCSIHILTNCEENKVYSFIVQGNAIEGNNDATLADINFSKGNLSPEFSSDVFSYTLSVDSSVKQLIAEMTVSDSNATSVYVNDNKLSDDFQSEISIENITEISVTVTAENGTTQKTYRIILDKIADYESTELAQFQISWGSENSFNALTTSGICYLKPTQESVSVTAKPVNANASVFINGISTNAETSNMRIQDGMLDISVNVIAQDGKTKKTYTAKCRWFGSVWEKVGNMPSYTIEQKVVYHNNKFCMGAYNTSTGNWTFYSSVDGKTWTYHGEYDSTKEETDFYHESGSACIFNNCIYLIGGFDGNSKISPIVSSSTNGTIYSLITATSNNTSITNGFASCPTVSFNGKLWILGGQAQSGNNDVATNNIWYSTDGATFTKASAPGWSARYEHTATVYNGKIYVIGGTASGNNELRDVWSSSNGTNWAKVTDSAAWTARNSHTVSAVSYGMFLVAGNDGETLDDVWFTNDGANWTLVKKNASFGKRMYHAATVKDGYLYIFGGNSDASGAVQTAKNDVWRTYIGE